MCNEVVRTPSGRFQAAAGPGRLSHDPLTPLTDVYTPHTIYFYVVRELTAGALYGIRIMLVGKRLLSIRRPADYVN